MSLSGLKKQLNKANQYMSEKIGGAEGTKLSEEFHDLEHKTDVTQLVVEDILNKTKDCLHPNPAARARVAVNTKIKGQARIRYPHPEQALGDCMCKYGKVLGKDSSFGQSLIQMGETLKEMTEIRYTLEDSVKQNFLEPLTHLQSRDLKDCMHHRKKLEGRRLDFDCKKRKKEKGTYVTETDIKLAEDKYNESLKLATVAMQSLVDNEREQVAQLIALTEALHDYHNQCANILKSLTSRLKRKTESKKGSETLKTAFNDLFSSAANTTTAIVEQYKGVNGLVAMNKLSNGISGHLLSSKISANTQSLGHNSWDSERPVLTNPCARALYDFKPETTEELPLKEGDLIELISQIDDNWFEGICNGKEGLFPISFVKVLVPLK